MAVDRQSATKQAETRRQTYVDAARIAFLRDGYSATTMSSIAAQVGGSKTTLWSHFPSKEGLFSAVLDDIIDGHATVLTVDLPADLPLPDVLNRFGTALLESILSEPIMALYRLVSAEAERFPKLVEFFYERGPRQNRERLATFMEDRMLRRELSKGDPDLAAAQFFALCQATSLHKIFFRIRHQDCDENLQHSAAAAVATFLRAWKV